MNEISVRARAGLQPASELRIYRLQRGVRLVEAALRAGISVARASTVERLPESARRGEIERLRQAIDSVAAQRAGAMEATP